MSLGVLLLAVHNVASFCLRLAALCWLPLRHTPPTAMAWLLVVFFWPLPGTLLYLFLGSTHLPRERKARHEKAVKVLRKEHRQDKARSCAASLEAIPGSLARFARLGQKLGEWPIIAGNRMEYVDSAAELFRKLADDIDNTGHRVDLMFYIFVADSATSPLVEALKRAAARGVECRLLVDALGSKAFLKKDAEALRQAGVQVVEALPLGRLLRRNRLTARYDLRNHRKLAVLDGKVGYMGSHNVTDPTYGGKARGLSWHDLTLRLEGPVVSQLEGVFLEDWFVETGEIPIRKKVSLPAPSCGEYLLQTVPSGPAYKTENFQRLVVSALFEARERVVITTPYLIPDDGLLQALEVAVLNGASVDLVVPRRVDQFLVGNAARAYYSRLLGMGVSLFLYQPGILHAKTMTVDGRLAFFGSSNFDIRSFALNFELNMVLYGEQEARSLLEIQERYMATSKRLRPEEWDRVPAWEKMFQGMAKLLSPIL
jgi:cardiolipin synthase